MGNSKNGFTKDTKTKFGFLIIEISTWTDHLLIMGSKPWSRFLIEFDKKQLQVDHKFREKLMNKAPACCLEMKEERGNGSLSNIRTEERSREV